MVAFVVKDFGGEIPRRSNRLLPDNMASVATNCDLTSGPLDGLPQPQQIIDLSAAAWPVRKAYRVPGPAAGNPDVWMPLPSEFSSVCRSPLTNDTLHRFYWTNPPGSPDAGAWWNTYDRLHAGATGANAHWSIGFIPPVATSKPTVSVTGGSWPALVPTGFSVVNRGDNYVPGGTMTVSGGTLATHAGTPLTLTLQATQGKHIAIVSQGNFDGTNGSSVSMNGTTGVGVQIQLSCTISGNQLTSIDQVGSPGAYTTNPTNQYNEPVVGGGLTGATVAMVMEVGQLTVNIGTGVYATAPSNPVQTTYNRTGSGCTLNVTYGSNGAPPLISRSYCYTFVDSYGQESSPSLPSNVLDGPDDASWNVSGLPASAPANPPGKSFPPVTKIRLYRTVSGASLGAQFYFVVELSIGTTSYADTIPDTTVVNNNLLESVSWAPPIDGLDGLIALPGGMLVGFTGNTVHFCEPDRPHAWPVGYDQSLLYPIVALALWQQSLIVLTQGFPSTGTGNSPAQFTFAQIQAPEPCIARGSVVTDLAGVYYASQNGLISLNYFGAQNQTLSNLTRELWQKEYQAAHIIACRHRAQYLAVNGTGQGFIIDYTEERMGIVHVSPFVNVVSVWNDVYTGDAYMIANDIVYLWDSTTTPSLIYLWRSREFYMQAPVSLGACQVSLDPSVASPAPTVVPGPPSGFPHLTLPPGINASLTLYVGPSQTLVHTEYLRQPRSIFRFPSGRKAFNWQFEIVSRVPVHSVEMASTMRELKGV